MNDQKLLKIGIVGSVIAALCCFTPVLVILFGALGISALLAGVDVALIPALIGFLGLTLFAYLRRRKRPSS